MLFAVDYNDCRVRIDETHSNKEYFCPYCGAPLITKKGDIRQHHFAHKSHHLCSDTWEQSHSYDISLWHDEWQSRFPAANQEVRLSLGETKHRADILIDRAVIEFQHSIMPVKAFDDRNNFYSNLGYKVIWLFDLSDLIDKGNISYSNTDKGFAFSWKNPKKAFNSYDVKTGCIDLFFQINDNDIKGPCIVKVTDVSESGFEVFYSSSLMSKNDFLEYVGLNNGECAAPYIDDLESNKRYLRFKEKHKIKLNKQQERALQAIEGSNLLLAVPGSGKTTVLVSRLGYMIKEKSINPKSILAITFSKNAAEEMKQRYITFFGEESGNIIDFRTINSLSLDIYKRYCKSAEISERKLIEGKELHTLYGKIYNQFHSDEYASESDILEFATEVSYTKNMMLSDEQIIEFVSDYPMFKKMYDAYMKWLKDNNRMDFNDQMVFAHWILKNSINESSNWQRRYKYICVDEAQDTSKIQHEIIRILAKENNIFMVGDEDQSIYGFRAAYPKALLNFRIDYKNPYILRMERNYRSTTQIVEKAQAFIAKNKGRYEKNMTAERGNGEPVELIRVASVEEQYRKILDIAKTENDEIAFLYRDNESSVVLIDLFLRNQIDFNLKKPEMNFFGHKVVLDIIAYLNIAMNPFDGRYFNQVCNKGIIFLKRKPKEYAIQNCKNRKISIYDALDEQMKYVSNNKKDSANDFKSIMKNIVNKTSEDAINILLDNGYEKYIEKNSLDFNKINILQLLAKQEPNIKKFIVRLSELEKQISNGFQNKENCKITLSTIHSSKGLEYDTVYMVDIYDGRFPSSSKNYLSRSKDNADAEQEERRLFYVGITRAKNRLALFSIENKPSTYIDEIFPEEKVARISAEDEKRRILLAKFDKKERIHQRKTQYATELAFKLQKENQYKYEKLQEEKRKTMEESKKKEAEQAYNYHYNEVKDLFVQQKTPIRDSKGDRWVQCEYCGKISLSDEFKYYGGAEHVNLGTCYNCSAKER